MPFPMLDRRALRLKPLRERENKVRIERDHVPVDAEPRALSESGRRVVDEAAERMVKARREGRARMLTFGAHSVKNGLSPLLIRLIEEGWVTHLATNGAGIIHDWEFAYQGESSEDVRGNVARGEFGAWEETGFYINLAIAVGAYRGLGYGESVGSLVENEGLEIPGEDELREAAVTALDGDPGRAAAAADLLGLVRSFGLAAGRLAAPHPYKRFGVQAAAYRMGVPLTGHPMIGHDIIYVHPMNLCAAIGRAAERDFLTFAHGVTNLRDGVYLSVGSAVMSPMVFEKSMSMAQNLARQGGTRIEGHLIVVVDLSESHWDWTQGEPPQDNPDYYLRYNKSFARMGGEMRYISADNRDVLLALYHRLRGNA